MVFCVSVILVAVSPLAFFILFIWLLSLFLLGKPGQRSIFIFSENQILVLLTF